MKFVVEMRKTGCDKVWYLAKCPVGRFVDSWDLRREEAHMLHASSPEEAIALATETKFSHQFDDFRAVPVTGIILT